MSERWDLIRCTEKRNTVSKRSLKYHQLMADGMLLTSAISCNRVKLASLLLQELDPFEAFLELPSQTRNFMTTFEASRSHARLYYLMFFRNCAFRKFPNAYTVDSLVSYCHLCSLERPLTFNRAVDFCTCSHCTNYRPYVEKVISDALTIPNKTSREDRTNVLLLFFLFGVDTQNMRFHLSVDERRADFLYYFVTKIWYYFLNETQKNRRRWLLTQFHYIFPRILTDYQTFDESMLVASEYETLLAPFITDVKSIIRTPLSLQHQSRCVLRRVFRSVRGLPYQVVELDNIPKPIKIYINNDLDIAKIEEHMNVNEERLRHLAT